MTVEFTHQFNFTKEESEILMVAFGAMLLYIQNDAALFNEAKDTFYALINQQLINSIEHKLVCPLITK